MHAHTSIATFPAPSTPAPPAHYFLNMPNSPFFLPLVGLFLCVCCSALLFLVCVWRCVNRRGARARTRPTQVVLPPLPERGPPPPFADVMYAGK